VNKKKQETGATIQKRNFCLKYIFLEKKKRGESHLNPGRDWELIFQEGGPLLQSNQQKRGKIGRKEKKTQKRKKQKQRKEKQNQTNRCKGSVGTKTESRQLPFRKGEKHRRVLLEISR